MIMKRLSAPANSASIPKRCGRRRTSFAVKFIESHATQNGNGKGRKRRGQRDISIFGQESNPTTWQLAHMNLAIRGIEDNLGEPFEEKMARLTADLREQMEQAAKLDKAIWANLEELGYGK